MTELGRCRSMWMKTRLERAPDGIRCPAARVSGRSVVGARLGAGGCRCAARRYLGMGLRARL